MFGLPDIEELEGKFDKLISTMEQMNKLLTQTVRGVETLNANIEKLSKQLSKKDG